MQAVMRGYLGRKNRVRHKVAEHMAAVRIVDNMVTDHLEASMIPNLLIDILRKNRLYEDLSLYSSDNMALMQTRE